MPAYRASAYAILLVSLMVVAGYAETPERIPVIFDTDIGEDIDDVWTLALILASPELDLRLICVSQGDTPLKARLVAMFLEQAGRGDIPIALGEKTSDTVTPQLQWASSHELARHPGGLHHNAAQAMADVIADADSTVVILSTAPKTNLASLLRRAPAAARRARVVAMSGSIRRGYGANVSPDAEYNVRTDIPAAQAVYQAEWPLAIAPLDVAGRARLHGDAYQRLIRRGSSLIDAVYQHYLVWSENKPRINPRIGSTHLYGALAVYLAIQDEFFDMEEMPLAVDFKGYTISNPRGKRIRVAVGWKDAAAFEAWMIERLLAWAPDS